MNDVKSRRKQFAALHNEGTFVMANAWDQGSARILATLGFPAIATTNSGHAASLGRADRTVTLDELVTHVSNLVATVDVPVSVDSEHCFADTAKGVAVTVQRIADTGAAGLLIEDYNPNSGIYPIDKAVERVAAAASAAEKLGLVLTARAENHLHGIDDLNDTIIRLIAYRDAGAHVVYAPGLINLDDIARVVRETGVAVNVLAHPRGPSVQKPAQVGVRRISTGGALAFAAYGALATGARELLTSGTATFANDVLSKPDRQSAFTS